MIKSLKAFPPHDPLDDAADKINQVIRRKIIFGPDLARGLIPWQMPGAVLSHVREHTVEVHV
jgi:hypothetical protein